MANIRSTNQIILSMLDFLRLAQPNADIKPGTVVRDLFVEAPASQLGLLYDSLAEISNKQSLRLVIGSDLDKLARNFGLKRRAATSSTGIALLTFASLNAPISINKGATISSNSGISFAIANNVTISPDAANFYKSIASKYKDQLTYVGIVDQYAIEVSVIATSPGILGNVGKYSLSNTTITGITNVTNINSFSGGTDQENDAVFRNRVLSTFNGASVGTRLGYINAALSTTGVIDATVVEPGDVLMTRDGSIIKTIGNQKVIAAQGSGGKVDVIIMGELPVENSDTFIFNNKSNSNDVTSSKNDVVLGQIIGDENKTINKKRIDNIAAGTLPAQPVIDIIQVSGSISGVNFKEKQVDQYGRVTGNYELIKDQGAFAGSPWSFDKFHWISDRVDFQEDKIKQQPFGQDKTTFTEVLEIPSIQQSVQINQENSIVTYDRSIIQLLHTPATNVTRVVNFSTGERYLVTDQNYDKTSPYNTTGRIKIAGNTLPSASDILQVDYNWILEYDQYSDYDGLSLTNNYRDVNDSIDWGYPYLVKNEMIKFDLDVSGNYYTGTASFNVNSVLQVNKFTQVSGTVELVASGVYTNSLSINIHGLDIPTISVDSIKLKNSNTEIYNSAQSTGSFSNSAEVAGIDIKYYTQIILPSDSVAKIGDYVDVMINSIDTFNVNNVQGSSNGTQITVPSASVDSTESNILMNVNYIANISEIFSSAVNSLPATKMGNSYLLNSNSNPSTNKFNIFRKENQIVQKNLSNQFYIEINLNNISNNLNPSMIISVIRLSDGKELWNNDNLGTVAISNTTSNYQIIFNGINAPVIGDRVMIIYTFTDSKKSQPFNFTNEIINNFVSEIDYDSTLKKYFVPFNYFTDQAGLVNLSVIDTITDTVVQSATDGYLTANINSAELTSTTLDFSNISELTSKKIKISNSIDVNNDGLYEIISYNSTNNSIVISNLLNKIQKSQISIIKLNDSKEIWNQDVGTIDLPTSRLILGTDNNLNAGDKVYIQYFNTKNLNQTPTRLAVTISDQVINTGVITISGTTLFKAQDVIFTATSNGLKMNLTEAVKKHINLGSSVAVSNNIKLAKILKLQKVTTINASSNEVLSVLTDYDVKNSEIKNNQWYADTMILNESLGNLEFNLPNTLNNNSSLPNIGDRIKVTFYYVVSEDTESLSYTRNVTLYTNKKFAAIDKIFVSSGFKSSQSAKISISTLTQPSLKQRYKVGYSYLAPKQNERIIINYNYNKLVADTTFNIENTRPINSDVLAKASKKTLIDLTMNVVIADESKNSTTVILQTLKDKLVSALTTTKLGDIVDTVTLINIAESISGIRRARILYLNRVGEIGKANILQADSNEYFNSNNIIINTESR